MGYSRRAPKQEAIQRSILPRKIWISDLAWIPGQTIPQWSCYVGKRRSDPEPTLNIM